MPKPEGPGTTDTPEDRNVENQPQESAPVSASPKEFKFSETTLFIKGIRHKVTEQSLSEFFGDFSPANIKIIKPRGFIKGLKPRAHNALVSFNLPEELTLDKIIENCHTRLFEGYVLTLEKAFASREIVASKLEAAAEEIPVIDPEKLVEQGIKNEAKLPAISANVANGSETKEAQPTEQKYSGNTKSERVN